jgi:predicted dehydrogenase
MLNAAIVGLGWWGRTLVRGAGASGDIRIVAGATGRRELAEEFAAEQGFRLLDGLEAVLADPEVEAVILATPHLDHEAHVIAAARAGKHIFIEKPFTLTKASAEAAIAAVEAAGVTIALGHNRRFHPHMEQIRRRVADGRIGKILHVEGTMTAPNGLFLKPGSWRLDPRQSPAGGMAGLGIHMVDGMIDIVGEIADVLCHANGRAGHDLDHADLPQRCVGLCQLHDRDRADLSLLRLWLGRGGGDPRAAPGPFQLCADAGCTARRPCQPKTGGDGGAQGL